MPPIVVMKRLEEVDNFAPLFEFIMRRDVDEISFGAKVTYAKLVQHCGKKHYCWPKMATLAREIGCGYRQVQRFVMELRSLGLISVESRGAKGRSNVFYTLDHPWIPKWRSQDAAKERFTDEFVGVFVEDEDGDTSDTEQLPTSGHECQGGGVRSVQSDRTLVSPQEEIKRRDPEEEIQIGARFARFPHSSPSSREATHHTLEEKVRDVGKHTTSKPKPSSHWDRKPVPKPEEHVYVAPPPIQKSANERMSEATRLLAEKNKRSEQARISAEQKAAARKEQKIKNLKGTKERTQIFRKAEEVWKSTMAEQFPGLTIGIWGGKEGGQVKQLQEDKGYPEDLILSTIRYSVKNWNSLRDRIKSLPTTPALGTIVAYSDALFAEAQLNAKYDKLDEEVAAWERENPGRYLPSELAQRLIDRDNALKNRRP